MRRASSFNFFRAYTAIVAGIVLVALLLNLLLVSFAEDDQEAVLTAQYLPIFRLLQRELAELAPNKIAARRLVNCRRTESTGPGRLSEKDSTGEKCDG